MSPLRAVRSSLLVLVPLVLVLGGASVAAVFPISEHISQRSISVTDNFFLVGGLMLLLVLSSLAQLLFIVRVVWGPGAGGDALPPTAPADEDSDGGNDDDLEVAQVRSLKVTGTKQAFVLVLLICANTVVLDVLGDGILVADTRAHFTLTRLRSPHAVDREEAVEDAISLTGDERVAAGLGRVMDEPGEAREWAAYAAGVRHDESLAGSLGQLMVAGSSREKAAAAMALARLGDGRLVPLAIEAFPAMDPELRWDLISAIGMLGKKGVSSEEHLHSAGEFLAGQVGVAGDALTRQLLIWALGRLEVPEGLAPIEGLLEEGTDIGTMCTGLQALGQIGAADSSPKIVAMIYEVDREVRCPEIVYADFTGHEVLLCQGTNLVARLLYEIANIGDRRARSAMERLAEDQSFSKTVRGLAGEIAFQMRYSPVER